MADELDVRERTAVKNAGSDRRSVAAGHVNDCGVALRAGIVQFRQFSAFWSSGSGGKSVSACESPPVQCRPVMCHGSVDQQPGHVRRDGLGGGSVGRDNGRGGSMSAGSTVQWKRQRLQLRCLEVLSFRALVFGDG